MVTIYWCRNTDPLFHACRSALACQVPLDGSVPRLSGCEPAGQPQHGTLNSWSPPDRSVNPWTFRETHGGDDLVSDVMVLEMVYEYR